MIAFGEAVTAALFDFLWQGAVVALLHMLTLSALRRHSAQTRYLAGCSALVVLAGLPVLGTILHYHPQPETGVPQTGSYWILPAWATGVVLLAVRPIWAWKHLRNLRRGAANPERWLADLAAEIARRMGVTQDFRVLVSSKPESPAVMGWLRPVILLPAATAAGLTVAQLEAVLAHEIAHIRRHDYLVNSLQVLVETLLFYHPAVWWVSSRIRCDRELCCDDAAVHLTGDALGYARALTLLEKLRPTPTALAVGSSGGALSYRIRRLVAGAAPQPERWSALTILPLALLCFVGSVTWVQAEQAQDRVTVEVTVDASGAITSTRVLRGPGYLRGLAIQATMEIDHYKSVVHTTLEPRPLPSELQRPPNVLIYNFPDAFRGLRFRNLFTDFAKSGVDTAERNLQKAASPQDRERAQDKLLEMRRNAIIVEQDTSQAARLEKLWNLRVLKHKLAEGDSPELRQAVAAAERDLVGK